MSAFFSWQWTGKDSATESSRGLYRTARVAPSVLIGLWLVLIALGVMALLTGEMSRDSLRTLLLVPVVLYGSTIWGFRYLAHRYIAYVRITPAGLEVTRGDLTSVHPWATVGEIKVVPFVQPALWSVRFQDGSPTVAFFTEGSSWMLFGIVRATSKLVDEIRRLAGEAGEPIRQGPH